MTTPSYEQMILDGLKDLPDETLAEIADFVFFVRKRILHPRDFAQELEYLSQRSTLRQLDRDEAAHLEEEFKDYEQRSLGNEYVADTMALVLRLEGRKIGAAVKSAFDLAEAGSATIHIPGMVLAEVLYLSEKKRISTSLAAVASYLGRNANCKEDPLSRAVVQAAERITDIQELHDRLIAGAALLQQIPLLTNDPVIQASTWVQAVW